MMEAREKSGHDEPQAVGSETSGPAVNARPEQKPLPLYIALEGGGAKGVVHVGALYAIENLDGVVPVYRGFSGTSAGSIVAALAAAGFKASQMVGLDAPQKTMLDELNRAYGREYKSAADLFGAKGWQAIAGLQGLATARFKWLSLGLAAAAQLAVVLGSAWSGWWLGTLAGVLLSVVWVLLARRWLLRRYRGLADLAPFRAAMDDALAIQFPPGTRRPIRFRDFTEHGKPTLKIVATNISDRKMELFSPETTPCVAVADAVVASCCIPVVFKPSPCEGKAYLDGGLVSNLPAWVFDEERALEPEATTIAVEINDPPVDGAGAAANWLVPALRTAIFGRGGLNKRGSGHIITLSMNSALGLLQFDAPLASADKEAKTVTSEVKEARDIASLHLQKTLVMVPNLLELATAVMLVRVREAFDRKRTAFGTMPDEDVRIRVAFAIPPANHQFSLRLQYSAGYFGEPDQNMLVPVLGSYAGVAFRSGKPYLVRDQQIRDDRSRTDLPPSVLRVISRAWPEMQWCLNVPVFNPAENGIKPALVVTIDCNCPINDADDPVFREFKHLIIEECGLIVGAVIKDIGNQEDIRR